MQSRNADEKMQQLPEPMKVIINRRDQSSRQASSASLADQNYALSSESLQLLHEDLQMRMRQSQGTASMPPPGFRAPPGLSAPPGLHEFLNSTWAVSDVGAYQHYYQHDPSFKQNRSHGHSSPTSWKGEGAKTREEEQPCVKRQDSIGSDSTASGDASSLAPSVTDDDDGDEVEQDKTHSTISLDPMQGNTPRQPAALNRANRRRQKQRERRKQRGIHQDELNTDGCGLARDEEDGMGDTSEIETSMPLPIWALQRQELP